MSRHGCNYLTRAHDLPELIAKAKERLAGIDFDTFVGTGLSGTIAAPVLAYALNKKFLIVRKASDAELQNHSGHSSEGHLGARWVFVDDLISSGDTFRRVADVVGATDPDTRYAGIYLYGGMWDSHLPKYFPPGARADDEPESVRYESDAVKAKCVKLQQVLLSFKPGVPAFPYMSYSYNGETSFSL